MAINGIGRTSQSYGLPRTGRDLVDPLPGRPWIYAELPVEVFPGTIRPI